MLRLLKIKKLNNKSDIDEIVSGVEESAQEIEPGHAEILPPINIFISIDQLTQLKDHDEDREHQAKMFLKSKENADKDAAVYREFVNRFEKAYTKLGTEKQACPHCQREYTSVPAEVKKCLGCSQAFFKTKRPQDGATVLVREENREQMAMQWENIKKAELIERINESELDRLRLKLEDESGIRKTLYDAHFFFVRQHVAKALLSGRFRLYSSLIYYMAEHDRYRTDFAQALTYYFYLYYLQLNGASNSVVFGDRVSVNVRTIDRIANLLKMAHIAAHECEDLFAYSIETLSAFDAENLPYTVREAYTHFLKSYKREEEGNTTGPIQEEKPKRRLFGR